jgi:hypothetical protein
MSKPIAQHFDGSDCYTPNCSKRHKSYPTNGSAQLAFQADVRKHAETDPREAQRQAAFKQEWRERVPGWKEMGFQYPVSVRKSEAWTRYAVEGKAIVNRLTPEQVQAIRFFTTNNYAWINAHLYRDGEALPEGDGSHLPLMEQRVESMNKFSYEQAPTQRQTEEIVQHLDEALASETQAEARVLYRGVNISQISKRANTGGAWLTEEQVGQYVDENFVLGSELQFDGYLSTSASPAVASRYSTAQEANSRYGKRAGIFLELKTKKGLNVSGVALYGNEAETLLPRGTRWRVAAVHKNKQVRVQEGDSPYGGGKGTFDTTLIQLIEID